MAGPTGYPTNIHKSIGMIITAIFPNQAVTVGVLADILLVDEWRTERLSTSTQKMALFQTALAFEKK